MKCSICLSAITPNEICKLKCQHVYCTNCIRKWSLKCVINQYKITCPMCKKYDHIVNRYTQQDNTKYKLFILEDCFDNWLPIASLNEENMDIYYADDEKARKCMWSNEITRIHDIIKNKTYHENYQKREQLLKS